MRAVVLLLALSALMLAGCGGGGGGGGGGYVAPLQQDAAGPQHAGPAPSTWPCPSADIQDGAAAAASAGIAPC